MDDDTNAKIHELARSLKSLHLAATMEEALARAKEAILRSTEESKPLAGIINALNKEDTMKPSADMKNITAQAERDEKERACQECGVKKTASALDEISCAIEDTKKLVNQAKKIKKKN